jgi:1,4-alpha-glucan branching enzyme
VDKLVVFERAGLLFIFNFHPSESFTDYRVGVEEPGEYGVVLSSDEGRFGGFDNIKLDSKHFTTPMQWNGRKNFLQVRTIGFLALVYVSDPVQVYIPSRTALVLGKI